MGRGRGRGKDRMNLIASLCSQVLGQQLNEGELPFRLGNEMVLSPKTCQKWLGRLQACSGEPLNRLWMVDSLQVHNKPVWRLPQSQRMTRHCGSMSVAFHLMPQALDIFRLNVKKLQNMVLGMCLQVSMI
jgi:hypothetical protein